MNRRLLLPSRRPRPPMARLATPPPGPILLVPPAHPPEPRIHPGQLQGL